jgi:hypothetical protein
MSKKIKIKIKESCCDHMEPKRDPCGDMSKISPKKMKNVHNQEEARMHRTTLAHLIADAKVLLNLVQDGDDLPEWLETKITKAGDYMASASRYIAGNIARDHGQLEEALTPEQASQLRDRQEITPEQMAMIIQNLDPEVLAAAFPTREDDSMSATMEEGRVGLTEEVFVEKHFKLYEYLQDAVDEDGNTPCPQCLYEVLSEASCGCPDLIPEAMYRGNKVTLNKPVRGGSKKFYVYVKKPNGKVVKVSFGDPNMRIKKSNPKRRKSFRARHNCKNPGPKWKARYWSCRKW